jgi:hypothetical protein
VEYNVNSQDRYPAMVVIVVDYSGDGVGDNFGAGNGGAGDGARDCGRDGAGDAPEPECQYPDMQIFCKWWGKTKNLYFLNCFKYYTHEHTQNSLNSGHFFSRSRKVKGEKCVHTVFKPVF